MFCTCGDYVQVHTQLDRIFFKRSDFDCIFFSHCPGSVTIVCNSYGYCAVCQVLFCIAVCSNVFVEFNQPIVSFSQFSFVCGVRVITQSYQSHREQVSSAVDCGDLTFQRGIQQIVVACDFDRACSGIIYYIDVVHQVRYAVAFGYPVSIIDVCGVRYVVQIDFFYIAASDQGFHVSVASHDQVIFFAAASCQFVDRISVVTHVGQVDCAAVFFFECCDQFVRNVLLPHIDVQFSTSFCVCIICRCFGAAACSNREYHCASQQQC